MALGDRIRQRRERLGWSQGELAQATHMPQTLISRLERGVNKNPGADVLKRLAVALHVSIDWLVGMYDEAPDPSCRLAGGVASP
jgi:transcriptional regulator with XRE-family HTH domain